MVDLVTPSNGRKNPGPPWRIALHVSFGAMVAFAAQTVAVIVFLVQMRGDISQLKDDRAMMQGHITSMDAGGTRELGLIRQRQVDLIASQAGQDALIRGIFERLRKVEDREVENKFWIDQLRESVKPFSHPSGPAK